MIGRWLTAGLVIALSLFAWSAWPDIHSWFMQQSLTNTTAQDYAQADVKFSDFSIHTTIPVTPARQAQGLAGRTGLSDSQGMLWLYQTAKIPAFWMKDMVIPIDILWIRDGRIVEITADIPPPATPEAQLPIYKPRQVTDSVLEVRAGFATAHGLQVGDVVEFEPPRASFFSSPGSH